MLAYFVRRILISIPTLLFVFILVFLLVRVAPGDPAIALLGDYAPESVLDAFREKMGLKDPLYIQFWRNLTDLLRGDLGRSMVSGVEISSRIKTVLPYTLELVFAGIVLGLLLGIPTGVVTALYRNKLIDFLGRLFSLIGISIPLFYLSILLLYVFAVRLGLMPVIGSSVTWNPLDRLHHLALPALALALTQASYLTRATRSAMLNVLNEDYIRTAYSKGLSSWIINYKHALRNTLLTITSLVGVYTVILIGGSILVEIVFSRPGLGSLMIRAMKQRDYTMLQSTMLVYAFASVIINLITDLIYSFIDPRIRYD